jgi:hypothetical protein
MNKPTNASDLDAILGSKYSHPDEAKPVTHTNPYASYTEQGNYEYVETTTYSLFNAGKKEIARSRICPDCETPALFECSCDLKDMECKNGHIWHFNKEGKVIKGDPHDD